MIAKRSPPSSCPALRTRLDLFSRTPPNESHCQESACGARPTSSGGYQVATCPLCQLSFHKQCIINCVSVKKHAAMMKRALGDVPAGTPIVPVDIGKMLCCLCEGFVDCEKLSEQPVEMDLSEPGSDSDYD